MGRIAAGRHLAKLSLGVVRGDLSLSVLVVLGRIASGAVAFFAPAAVAYSIEEMWLAVAIGAVGVYLSTSLFRQKWGEQLAGAASIGILFTILGMVPAVLLVSAGLASGSTAVTVALVVVGALIAVAAGILGSAARGVFAVALYRYAADAGATGPFTGADLESAVLRKA